MSELFLAVDIGNSAVKLALFEGARLKTVFRVGASAESRREPAFWIDAVSHEDNRSICASAICSVVPQETDAWIAEMERRFGFRPYVIGPETDFGLRIAPEPASSVGRDRLVNAVAAYEQYGGPVIAVSIGTAATVDAVSKDGVFLGGAIAPGPGTAAKALFQAGAQLPEVPLTAPEHAIGRNTVEAMQSGIVLGYAGLLDGLVERIRGEAGGRARVVVTGGWAELFAGLMNRVDGNDRTLTFEGIRRVWLRNQK